MSRANQIWANVETGLAYPINTSSIISDNITFKTLTSKAGEASTITVGAGGTLATATTTFLTTSSTNLSSDGTPVLIGGGGFVGQIIGNGGLVATGGSSANNALLLRSTTNGTKGMVHLDEVTPSTAIGTGSLVVDGGASVGGQLWVTGINVPAIKSGNVFSIPSMGGSVVEVANFTTPVILRMSAMCIGNEVNVAFSIQGNTTTGFSANVNWILPAGFRSTNFSSITDAVGSGISSDFAGVKVYANTGAQSISIISAPELTTDLNVLSGEFRFTRN